MTLIFYISFGILTKSLKHATLKNIKSISQRVRIGMDLGDRGGDEGNWKEWKEGRLQSGCIV